MQISREQQVSAVSISTVLKGRTKSARLEAALQARARELVAKEQADAKAAEASVGQCPTPKADT